MMSRTLWAHCDITEAEGNEMETKKAAVRLTPDQAAELVARGMFSRADRNLAKRLRRQGKMDAAKKAERDADERMRSFKDRI